MREFNNCENCKFLPEYTNVRSQHTPYTVRASYTYLKKNTLNAERNFFLPTLKTSPLKLQLKNIYL